MFSTNAIVVDKKTNKLEFYLNVKNALNILKKKTVKETHVHSAYSQTIFGNDVETFDWVKYSIGHQN